MDIKEHCNYKFNNSAQTPLKWAKILLLGQVLSFCDFDINLDLVGK